MKSVYYQRWLRVWELCLVLLLSFSYAPLSLGASTTISSIKLSASKATLRVGMRHRIFITKIKPASATDSDVLITSSDTSVATVTSYGLIIAQSPGKATITVKAVRGKASAKCVITVKPPSETTTLDKAADAQALEKRSSPPKPNLKDALMLDFGETPRDANAAKTKYTLYNQKTDKNKLTAKDDVFSLMCAAYYALAYYEDTQHVETNMKAIETGVADITAEDMAAIRAWLRKQFPDADVGNLKDLVANSDFDGQFGNGIMDPIGLDYYGGVQLNISSIHRIDSTHYTVICDGMYAALKAMGYLAGFIKQPDGTWKLDIFMPIWVS